MCMLFTSQHCQGNVVETPSCKGSMATDLPYGIFLSCCGVFLTSVLVIIVNDIIRMLSFPITRIYKDWTFM